MADGLSVVCFEVTNTTVSGDEIFGNLALAFADGSGFKLPFTPSARLLIECAQKGLVVVFPNRATLDKWVVSQAHNSHMIDALLNERRVLVK